MQWAYKRQGLKWEWFVKTGFWQGEKWTYLDPKQTFNGRKMNLTYGAIKSAQNEI